MAIKDEAAGGGGGGRESRVIFFEIVAGVRLFQKGMATIKTEFASVAANWKQIQTGMTADQAAELAKQTKTFETVLNQQQLLLAEQTAKYEEEYNKRATAVDSQVARETKAIEDGEVKNLAVIKKTTAEMLAEIEKRKLAFDEMMGNVRAPSITGPANIGAGIATVGALQQAQDEEAIAKQHTAEMVALKQDEGNKLKTAALQNMTEQTTVAEQTSQAVVDSQKKIVDQADKSGSALSRLGGVAGMLGSAFAAVSVGALVFGGVLGALYQTLTSAVTAVSDWAAEIVQASEALGLTYKNTQVYLSLVEQFGVSHTIAETILARFNKRLQENAGLFQSLGITARNPNDALMQFITLIGKSNDKIALFNQVLGGTVRSGSTQALIDAFIKIASSSDLVVAKGTEINGVLTTQTTTLTGAEAGWQRYAQVMDQTGMLLSNATVQAGALSQAIQTQLGMAFEGLKMRIGAAIMPELQAIELVMIALIDGTGKAGEKTGVLTDILTNLSTVIAKAVGYIIGFVAGIAGISQADLAKIFTDAATSVGVLSDETAKAANHTVDLKQQLKDLTEQQKNLESSTKLQTEAIDNQITALQRNQKAFDDAHNDKVQALRDEKTNYEDQLKLQDDLHQSYLVQLQDQLQALKDTTDSRRQSGEDLASYETRLAENSLSKQITGEQDKRNLITDTMQQNIDAADQTAKAVETTFDDQTASLITNLQNQKTALADHLTQMQAAIQTQTQAINDELNGTSNDITQTAQLDSQSIATLLKTALQQTSDTATTSGLKAGAGFVGNFMSIFTGAGALFVKAGEALGESLMSGILSSAVMSTGLGFIAAQLTGDSTKIMLAAVKAMNSATSLDSVNAIAKAAIGSNMLDDQERNTVASVQSAMAQKLIGSGNQGSSIGSLLTGLSNGKPVYGPAYAMGGIINSPVFGATLGESGREAVIPLTNPVRANQVMKEAGIGGNTFVANFNGPIATGQVADIVISRLASDAKRKGLILGAGL